jgi:hypothetical protein
MLTKNVRCVWPAHKGHELIQCCTMAVCYYSTNGENRANWGASSATCDPNGTILVGRVPQHATQEKINGGYLKTLPAYGVEIIA